MRHSYAGDEGDYAKLALLRALTRDRRLGVNWYLTVHPEGDGQPGGGDGNFRKHLHEDGWDHLDPELLDRMRSVFGQLEPADRRVALLEDEAILPGATFFHDELQTATPLAQRVAARQAWHRRALHTLADTDMVFVDPDNGFQVKGHGPGSKRLCKYATFAEVADYLARGQAVVAYQHKPRLTWEQAVQTVRRELSAHRVPTAPPGFIAFEVTAASGRLSAFTTLAAIVADYVASYRPRPWVAFQARQRPVHEALDLAATLRDKDGKVYSHQTRVSRRAKAAAGERIRALDVARVSGFEDLHPRVEAAIGAIPGIGALAVYDVSLRIGASLGVFPERVYLQAGALRGARALGLETPASDRSPWLRSPRSSEGSSRSRSRTSCASTSASSARSRAPGASLDSALTRRLRQKPPQNGSRAEMSPTEDLRRRQKRPSR